jgi:ABC-type multidrug transport system fused ATPase/permease subunit
VSTSSSGLDANVDVIDYELSGEPSGKKKFFRKPFLLKILKFNAPEWRWILLGAICSLINGATQPIFSLLFTVIYGLFAEPDLEKQKHLTSVYAGIIFIIGFVGSITQFLSSVGFAESGEALTMRMRKLTFSAMLRQEIAYFDHEMNSVGALVTRLSSDASSLKVIIYEKMFFFIKYNKMLFLGINWSSYRFYFASTKCYCNCTCNCIFFWLEINISCFMFCSSFDAQRNTLWSNSRQG